MRFKGGMLITLLLLAILTIGTVSASEDVCDDNLAVSDDLNFKSSVDDSNERLETGVDSILMDKEVYDFKDLNDLINASAENSEVKLVKDYVYNASADEDYKNGINIAKTLTIDGQGHYIDGNFQARIFNVAGNDVTLKNIKLNNAGSKAFVVSGSNCRISGCEFVNCSCDDGTVNGGVISIGSGSIVNCSFTDCVPNVKKTVYGGALRVSGTDVVNCVFTNCSYGCDLVYGGAIYLNSGRIINCSFSHCAEACGSLYGSAIEGAGSIINCTFSNNSLSYAGDVHLTGVSNVTGSYFIDTPYGIRCNYGCVGNISNCTFERCSNSGVSFWCNGGNVTDCIFTDCHSQSAIYIHDSYVDVKGCRFDNCSSNSEGGAINIVERFDNIIDCTFVNCSSKNGGAIYAQDCNDTVTNCTFINCSADNGGAIYWNSANGKIDGSHFVKSRATAASSIYVSADNVTVSNSRFESDVTYDIVYGGILINCTLNGNGPVRDPANDNTFYGLRDLILDMNPEDTLKLDKDYLKSEVFVKDGITISKAFTIDGQGHKIDADAQGRIFNINANNVTIKNIEFLNANYKAIVVSGTNCSIINCSFNNCTFIGDTVGGGVISMNSGTITDCRFTNCSSSEWLTYGGVLSISDCNVTNCFFANCSQGQDLVYGGAIDMDSSNVVNCTFSHCGDSCGSINGGAIEGSGNVINCTFLDCACTEAFGGAIHFEGPSTLACSTFINCYKAVVCQYGCIGNIYDCDFINCSNYAMMFTARESNVTNCRFKNISSEYGAIYIHVSTYVNITGCEFTDCNAERGGAIYIELSSHNNRVENCKFIKCSSDGGAAIYIDCSNNTVKSCEFVNCFARSSDYGTYGGGAIYVGNVANNAVINSTFINCSADNGGSVFWNGENGTLSDSNFENSTARDNGGSVYWNAKKGKIINSNFMGSKAKNGGAVYVAGNNEVTIDNSVFEKNQASRVGGAVYGGNVSNCEFNQNSLPEVFSSGNDSADVELTVIISQNVSVGSKANIYIDFASDITDSLIVKIDKKTFGVADIEEGIVDYTFSTAKLSEGKHIVTFDYEGDQFDKSIISGNYEMYLTPEEIPVPEEIVSDDDGVVALEFPINATGTLTVYVDGEIVEVIDVGMELMEFLAQTNKTVEEIVVGILKIDLSEYKGNYLITFAYSGDENYQAFEKDAVATVYVNHAKISASNAKVLYSAGQTYTIKVYSDEDVLARSGKVVVKANNKAFKTLTIKNGIASFKVTQVPGTYKLTITSLGKTVKKTLTVKHVVTLKTATVKRSAKSLVLTATLSKINKKYLKNKKVTFKFNGKTYKAKTNSKGVAKVTIKSSVLKKLKVGKKVTYQATYLKDTVKKTSKIKK